MTRTQPISVATGTDFARRYECSQWRLSEVRFPPGATIPRHVHEHACLSVVLEGQFAERLSSSEHMCRPAHVLFKPALEWHADRIGESGSRQLIVEIEAAGAGWLGAASMPLERIVQGRSVDAEVLARLIVVELAIADAASGLAIQGLTLELFACALRLDASGPPGHAPRWLRRARAYVEDRFATAFTLADVAAEAGVHPAHLARTFRRCYGVSIGGFVRRLRIDRAKHELALSSEPIARIATRAGFTDQAHLTRWFRRDTGLTPLQYRVSRGRGSPHGPV